MQALVDGDIVAFRSVASKDPFTEQEVGQRVAFSMQQILSQANADTFRVFLTGKGNFRKKVNPEYKANRKDKIPPEHLQYARQILIDKWGAEVCTGYEADDGMGLAQDKEGNTTIICTIDKDLEGKVEFKKIDVETNGELSQQYQVMSIPTFIIVKNNKETSRKVGAMPKEVLKDWIDSNL